MDEDRAYSMCFGVSCAFFALRLMSRGKGMDAELGRGLRVGEMMLRGSASLLGLLVWRAQKRGEELMEKLAKAELEVAELRRRRVEDAKANEKVVGIFAAHEQTWIAERKQLRLQIHALVNELRVTKTRNEETVSNLSRRVEEEVNEVRIKDDALEEEGRRRGELEEKLQAAEAMAVELRGQVKSEAQDHSSELWRHKTAFVELVSNHRQLEAELSRVIRQFETVKQELDEAFEQKQEAASMIEKLSTEVEQKDKILSAMLRKSKFDTAEKQMLLKEVKICKAKKKQAELDSERWKNMCESRHKKKGARSVEGGSSEDRRPELKLKSTDYHPRTLLLEYLEAEGRREHDSRSMAGENVITTVRCLDQYSFDGADDDELVTSGILQDWVRLETDRYTTVLEQNHNAEIEAFTEQLRLKDEKLEAFNWQILSMELGSKRLQSHIEGLDGTLTQLRDDNLKLEAVLMDREKEVRFLQEQLNLHNQHLQKSNSKKSTSWAFDPQALWSEVRITKKKSREKEQESKPTLVRNHESSERKLEEGHVQSFNEDLRLLQLEPQHRKEPTANLVPDVTSSSSNDAISPISNLKDYPMIYVNELSVEEPEIGLDPSPDQAQSATSTMQFIEEIEEEKEVSINPVHDNKRNMMHEKPVFMDKSVSFEKAFTAKDSPWKMDIHALGVSYKIKRLKQQLLVLEKLAGGQAMKQLMSKDYSSDSSKDKKFDKNTRNDNAFPLMISLLHKQVKRYQSLEEKTDSLCKRMDESYRTGGSRDAHSDRTKEQSEMLEGFLEETFQLQRFMVATGQKLVEVQSRITCIFVVSDGFDESAGFNMRQFSDVVRTLFREIQRGLEVRISRIIGDLEGTLACDGILHR